jgi:hypothetical protein
LTNGSRNVSGVHPPASERFCLLSSTRLRDALKSLVIYEKKKKRKKNLSWPSLADFSALFRPPTRYRSTGEERRVACAHPSSTRPNIHSRRLFSVIFTPTHAAFLPFLLLFNERLRDFFPRRPNERERSSDTRDGKNFPPAEAAVSPDNQHTKKKLFFPHAPSAGHSSSSSCPDEKPFCSLSTLE